MKYSQIVDAYWEKEKPLDEIPMTPAERIAWEILDELNELGGFDDWWHAVDECDEQNAVFARLAKRIKKELDR